jgi:hypothetical protein
MDDLFDSPWLKWMQGVVNADVLQDNLNELARPGVLQMQLGMTQEYDPKRHCIIIKAGPTDVPRIFPIHQGLLLGDIVHNFRACLDHLAWALYKRGRTPNLARWQEQGVYFPIATTREQFNDCLRGSRPKLPGVRRSDVAIVRRYQPYIHGKRNLRDHVLVILDKLAIADKHRTILPIEAVPERATHNILEVRDCVITRYVSRRPRVVLEPGAELVRFYVRKTGPSPEIYVEPHFTIDPTVDGRAKFEDWAGVTLGVIAQLLREFAVPPSTVQAFLKDPARSGLVRTGAPVPRPLAG